ncbi:tape measure protein [Oscillibacter sp.]|uniref:tape measure protein n=1 Tax=Oscillibacter sp. TaxID=1945593 RepID=UPI003397A666
MAETSIVFKAHENISQTMRTIASSGKGLSKEFEELERRGRALESGNAQLQKKLGSLNKEMITARNTMKEAERAFKKTGDATDGLKFSKAVEEYERLTSAIKETKDTSGIMVKSMKSNTDEMRKIFDETGRMEANAGNGGLLSKLFSSDLGAGLARSGIFRDLGNSISGMAGTLIESAVGQPVATALSETLSGAVSGAAAGAIAGVPGMVAGGVIGTVSGALNASNQIYQQQDDAFKDYYKNLYETEESGTAETLGSGTTIAGSREQTQMAFAQRFGSDEAATAYLDKTRELAKDTNYTFDEITGYSKKLLNSYDPDGVFGVLKTLSDASAGLDLTSSDVDTFISGLSRMRTTGKATQEYLNYFSERGVDVYQALSDATGADRSKIADMITGGKISGEGAAQAILNYINQNYGGLSDKLAGTYDAMVDNLGDVMDEIKAAGGMGYTEERKSSVDADLSAYGGALGDKLAELSTVGGKVQAYGENMKDQYQREALSAVLLGQKTSAFTPEDAEKLESLRSQYQEAEDAWNGGSMEAGQKMTDLKEEAESLATAAFESSDWSEKLHDAELDQINATRELTTGLSAATNALEVSNAFTKGGKGDGIVYSFTNPDADAMNENSGPGKHEVWKHGVNGSNAFGLRRVPETGLYLLHQDETVKTAAESRAGSGDARQILISGNEFNVRQESDVPAIAAEILRQVDLAEIRSG